LSQLKNIVVAAAVAAMAAASTPASALTTVSFAYELGATPVATGSFSYADGLSGVLGYGDLNSFSVTANGVTYDLADVLTLTDYVHFAYDTAAGAFVTNFNTCGYAGCGYESSLSAINGNGNFGFFFSGAPGLFTEYSTYTSGEFDTITFSGGAIPEPASWAMMIAGFGLVGAAMRRRALVAG
jgi:hypothetical protein